jgi:chemotaxis protein methyltransferase CheR
MSTAVDESLLRYLSTRSGLTFEGSRGDILQHSVAHASARVGSDPAQLLSRVTSDDRAFAELCDHITVRETFFFRERPKFELLRRQLLERHANERRTVRIWSAGCASGEEAYSLANVVRDAGLRARAQIIGTDLSPAAIAAARTGSYGRWAIRGLDQATTDRVFTVREGRYHVRDELRTGVEFHQHNLLDPLPEQLGPFDVIFCRNLLIYFTPAAVEQAVDRLVAALAPGGLLVTGVADPMLDQVDGLCTVVTEHGLVYRRRDATTRTEPSSPALRISSRRSASGSLARSLSPSGDRSSGTRHPEGHEEHVLRLVEEGELALQKARPHAAEAAARRLLELSGSMPAAHRILVQALAQAGRLSESVAAAGAAVAAHRTVADLHSLYAAVLLLAGGAAEAQQAAHRAVYLDPRLVEGYAVLAQAHEALGEHARARQARRNIRRLLAAEAESA